MRSENVVSAGAGEGVVVVAETRAGRFQQRIDAGGHTFLADEPIGVGDGTGPSPYDLILAGLGACTSMTLRMYADRHRWPLDRVSVRLTHDRRHAEDCRDPNRVPCVVDTIDRTIEVHGALDDAQRERLLDIAERCPVHRTLTGDIRIRTQLTGA
jgi:putative redox protein